MTKTRYLGAALVIATVVAFLVFFDLSDHLTLEYLQSQHARIKAYKMAHPYVTALAFFLIYIVTAGLSLPGSSLLPLLAGAIFGLLWGTVLVSIASTIAATLEFLAARHFLRDAMLSRFSYNVLTLNTRIKEEGAYYLFALRLVPFAPFLVINLAMGLTPINTLTYVAVSLSGMIAGTVVFVNVGTHLGKLDTLSGLLSPDLIASFMILGLFPLAAKKFIKLFYNYRVSKRGVQHHNM